MHVREFETSLGRASGRQSGGSIHVARLRYAKPPVGALRFAMPEPVEPWGGTLEETGAPVVPPQLGSRLAAVMGDYPAAQSEDCLHLDIWVPAGVEGPMPVMVFIHGGAFMTGGGSMECYDASVLAARGRIVVVNISYRLGALGFLAIDGMAPPNLGLHDQVMALEFIRREIAAFGGDAANITVVGQSAGAFSIAALLATAKGRALFDRAVMISAPLGVVLRSPDEAAPMAAVFLEALGVEKGDRNALAAVPVARILEAQGAVLRAHVANGAPDNVDPPFMPVIDGDLVEGDPLSSIDFEGAAAIPVMVGATREEYAAFWFARGDIAALAGDVLDDRFERAFPGRGKEMLAQFAARRAPSTPHAILSDLRTETDFIQPMRDFAHRHEAAGGTTYMYLFDWQAPDPRVGACHCIELPFLFGNLATWERAPIVAGVDSAELEALSHAFQGAIVGFARSGDPQDGSALVWPPYRQGGPVLHFDRKITCSTDAPGAAR